MKKENAMLIAVIVLGGVVAILTFKLHSFNIMNTEITTERDTWRNDYHALQTNFNNIAEVNNNLFANNTNLAEQLNTAIIYLCPKDKASLGTRQEAILGITNEINEQELEIYNLKVTDAWIAGRTPCATLWYFYFDYLTNRDDQGKLFVQYDPRIKEVIFISKYSQLLMRGRMMKLP